MSDDVKYDFEPAPNFESSNIASMGYSRQEKVLLVRFKTGAEYAYYEVPAEKWTEMLSIAEARQSVGKWFHTNIRPHFEAKKVAGVRYGDIAGKEISMLWSDNSPERPTEERIGGAVAYYTKKYDAKVVRVEVYDGCPLPESPLPYPVIMVPQILKNHFYVVGEKS